MVYLGEQSIGFNSPAIAKEIQLPVVPDYVRPSEWPDLEAILAAHPASEKGYGYAYAMLVEGRNSLQPNHYITVPAKSAGCRHYVTSWGLDEDAKTSTQKWVLSDPQLYQEYEWIVVYTDSAQDITVWGPNYYPYMFRWLVWFYAPEAVIQSSYYGFCGVRSVREVKAKTVRASSLFFEFGDSKTCKIDVEKYIVAENSANRNNGTAFPINLDKVLDLDVELSSTVHDMHDWFNGQYELVSIKNALSTPPNVSAMYSMFVDCGSLTGLDVSHFDMQNVVNCNSMFTRCLQLKSLDTNNWDMHSVRMANQMFQDCRSLSSIDTSSWYMPDLSTSYSMFYYCTQLKNIDLHNASMKNNTTFESMFSECRLLETADCHGWTVSAAQRMNNMFNANSNLTSANLSGWQFGDQLSTAQNMFGYCSKLEHLDVSDWNFKCTHTVDSMFRSCQKLKSIDVANWDMSQVKIMQNMFNYCVSLTALDVSDWDTSNVSSMNGMFQTCRSLLSIDVSDWDVSNVTNMESMFNGCWLLSSNVDMSSWDVSKVTNARSMFNGCYSVQTFIMPNTTIVFQSQFIYSNALLYDFRACTSVPTLEAVNAFQGINANAKIVVPDSLYSSWRTAANWSNSNIQPKIVSATEYESN